MSKVEFQPKCTACKGDGILERDGKKFTCTLFDVCKGKGDLGTFTAKTKASLIDSLQIEQQIDEYFGSAEKNSENFNEIADYKEKFGIDESYDKLTDEEKKEHLGKVVVDRNDLMQYSCLLKLVMNRSLLCRIAELKVMVTKKPREIDFEKVAPEVHKAIWKSYYKAVEPFRPKRTG